jgi:LytTr DNA-binding domain
MRLPFLLLACWLLIAAAPIERGPLQLCTSVASDASCVEVGPNEVRLGENETVLRREIGVDPAATEGRPLMVTIMALASAEVRWNGAVIGRNGVPGLDGAEEVAGRYVSSFMVPARQVRPGANVLTVRLTAQHLWLPVQSPLHGVWVGFYETPQLPGLGYYLPALLTLGALLAGLVYFAATFLGDRGDKGALALALAAAASVAQLLIEVSRAFVAYNYPWHIARVGAIALLAAATATLLAFYVARRFVPGWVRPATLLAFLLSASAVIFLASFDYKAIWAVIAGAVVAGGCAAAGWRAARGPATGALGLALAALLLMVWDGGSYLDRSHYLLLAVLFITLISEQVIALRRARAERDEQARIAAALAARLRAAEEAGEPILALRDGSRIHRVAEGDVVAIRAADDYCDVTLAGGRDLLVTMTLARLLDTLPPRFMRVHKSHAVNRANVTGTAPRPGGGMLLVMSDGNEIPVGRAYARAVGDWLKPSPAGR